MGSVSLVVKSWLWSLIFVFDVRIWWSYFFFFSSRRRHTRYWRDWSSDVCSSDLNAGWINGGDWLRFDGVNFGATPPASVNVRVASESQAGGRVEIRVGSPDAAPVDRKSVV